MKNRRNIIESELPPQKPLDIWMKDGKFYRSTNKGWVLIENQMEFTNSELMSKSTATSGTIGVNKETGEASIYNDVTKEWNPLDGGGGGMTETTWQELKDLRDSSKLIPGALYRITDYNCTTTQENTQSAGHQFDIVLLALSANKLAEEGWAMMHDTPIYDVIFTDDNIKCYLNKRDENVYDVVSVETLLGIDIPIDLLEPLINEESKTIDITTLGYSTTDLYEGLTYNYFQNSNLSAWKVWYCLDNDTARFAWADDSVDEGSPASIICNSVIYNRDINEDMGGKYGWRADDEETDVVMVLTNSETPSSGDDTYVWSEKYQEFVALGNDYLVTTYTPAHEGTGLPNGRGVIYRLIDEWNNDVGYDFKNIQFVRPMTDGEYDPDNGEQTWVYTFDDGFLKDRSIPQPDGEGGFHTQSKNNCIKREEKDLNEIVAFNCDSCTFSHCVFITLNGCSVLTLNSCSDMISSYEYNNIYINNKKVLTEE